MEIDSFKLRDLMLARQQMYSFTARLFLSEVDLDLLNELRQMDFSGFNGVPEIELGFKKLGDYLQAAKEDTITELAVDYARVFLGTGSRQAGNAFPYESVYTSQRGLLMQEARNQVVEIYRQEGLQCSAERHLPEDHIAIELEFMVDLCEKLVRSMGDPNPVRADDYIRRQVQFLRDHLGAWAQRFCSDVQQCAATDFYKAAASITNGFLEFDQTLLSDLLATNPTEPQPVR